MEELDYWRLCEELNVVQAALLVVGEDASLAEYAEGWDAQNRPKGYEAAKTAICGGLKNFMRYQEESSTTDQQVFNIQSKLPNSLDEMAEDYEHLSELSTRSISGILVPEMEIDINGNILGFMEDTVDVYRSMVNADSLKQWLRHKGFTTGFFFPELVETMDFLDPHNQRYAPKLAAAVKAWQAVTDAGSKSPKQALNKWLREHAVEFKLTSNDGSPIEQAIEECSKVANWKLTGGAPKTPS